MEFLLLGPVEVRSGTGHLRLSSQRQRALLAALLLTPGVVVPPARLVEVIWGEAAPPSAMANLRTHVAQLRRQLAELDAGARRIHARAGGYLIEVRPDELDLERFERLAAAGRRALLAGDGKVAAEILGKALALWRGRPLANLPATAAFDGEAHRLTEARLGVVEHHCRARLDLGACSEVAGELHRLVVDHPLRERLWALLMLALAGAGQQAAALGAYDTIRSRLATELGAEPGADLRAAQLAVLRQAGPVTSSVSPAQLPRAAAGFHGRHAELQALDHLLPAGDGSRLAVVVGTAGVGKSDLAVQWAHRVRDRFPDGQLYADLHRSARPSLVLGRFLRALGVPAREIPDDLDEAAALFRSVLAAKAVLCVLDDALDAEHVRPLLPAAPRCMVVVTSRNRLDGLVALDGAHRLALDVLGTADAVAVLGAAIGPERAAREPAATAELAETCARLPLALRITGAQIRHRTGRRVADHLSDLRDHGVLDSLTTDGDTSALRVAYDLSYEALDPATRRTFRLLGLVPGPDTTVPAVAALTGAPASTAARQLERLALAHLVQEHAPGRYRLHDLLRRYAGERAHSDCLEDERDTATHALLDHYLARTAAAADILYPFVLRMPETEPQRSAFDSEESALAWLNDEVPTLVAAIRHAHAGKHHRLTWQLVDALRGHCMTTWLAEAPELARIGLDSAEALGLPDVRAAAHNNLAATHALRYEFPSAITHFRAALALYRTAQVRRGVTGVLGNLATVHLDAGDLDRADALFAEAAALDPLGSALRRQSLGVLHEYRGRLAEAATAHAERAAESHSPHDLVLLARVHARGGDYGAALPVAEEAATNARKSGDRCTEAYALAVLGTVHAGTGDPARAVRLAGTALEFARGTGVPGAEIAGHAALAVSLLAAGHHQRALVSGHHALRLARRTGTRFDECEALITIGRIHHAAGSTAQGDHYLGSARHLAETHGYHGLAEAVAELSACRGETRRS
ncbi:SARP family transcriptional regulator [Amycolatopsis sp. NBRC 101858]|uniref:AfsR/SARP family transcriptional regulator n=1 Tax=Amycolatopsis sp. NBRC 101858 TaxID=3032200 RepID=UPI0024A14C2C|nr:BTAD domain-containing putative transcriptional regulator [Amycolatopsis sp. NBRC 101858]GLY36128.1 SARP family transcriptional regulator [Amycolatopsis sp. NBRC 101858]